MRPLRAAKAALLLLPLALILAGCPLGVGSRRADESSRPAPAPILSGRSAGAFARIDPWLLTTTDRNAARGNRGIFLGNGYLGATFGADGGAGKDSACYVAGVYYGENEALAPLPIWNYLDQPDDPTEGSYSQTLDMKRGLLVTRKGGVTVTAFISRKNPLLAVLHVEGSPLPRTPPRVPVPRIWAAVSPPGARAPRCGALYRTKDQRAEVYLRVTQKADPSGKGWTRFVTVAGRRELSGSLRRDARSYEDDLAEHTAAWSKLWKEDIIIEGDPEAQQLVHALMFNLLCSVRTGGADSVPPETWSGDFYKGHIFWDADVWMFPALLAQHPDLARCILDYRYNHLQEARRHAEAAGYPGADFPWESAATGREVAPSGFSEGRHVTAGVGWAHWQYWLATGDRAWLRARGWPVLREIADYWSARAKKDPARGRYVIRGVEGPDENKGLVDNNTYTNALARYCLRAAGAAAKTLGKRADPHWADVAKNIALPYDKAHDRYLAREADDGAKTKQADGELVLYPARLPMSEKTANNTFSFHAARPIASGPAMTSSIHALLAARLGRAAEAEKFFRSAYRPFVRGPFLLFSEKRSLDRCCFVTGAGGVLQSVLYGFGGLQWEDFAHTPPRRPAALPSGWKRLLITGIRHGREEFTLEATPRGRRLTRQ